MWPWLRTWDLCFTAYFLCCSDLQGFMFSSCTPINRFSLGAVNTFWVSKCYRATERQALAGALGYRGSRCPCGKQGYQVTKWERSNDTQGSAEACPLLLMSTVLSRSGQCSEAGYQKTPSHQAWRYIPFIPALKRQIFVNSRPD